MLAQPAQTWAGQTEIGLDVSAGISTDTIRHEWLYNMSAHLIFGLPATLIMFLTVLLVLRRTRSLYDEVERMSGELILEV